MENNKYTFNQMTEEVNRRKLARLLDDLSVAEIHKLFSILCESVDEQVMAEAIVDAFGKEDSQKFAEFVMDTPRASQRRAK